MQALINLLFLWASAALPSTSAKVHLDKIGGRKGTVYLAVYDNSAHFLDTVKVYRKRVVPVNGVQDTDIDLGKLPAGEYAIALFLDENGNGKMDKNMLGIPKEKYGFSGSRHPAFRAPSFDEAKVTIDAAHSTIAVSLK